MAEETVQLGGRPLCPAGCSPVFCLPPRLHPLQCLRERKRRSERKLSPQDEGGNSVKPHAIVAEACHAVKLTDRNCRIALLPGLTFCPDCNSMKSNPIWQTMRAGLAFHRSACFDAKIASERLLHRRNENKKKRSPPQGPLQSSGERKGVVALALSPMQATTEQRTRPVQ